MEFVAGLPEFVRDSRLEVEFASEGPYHYTIHPQSAIRRSRHGQERWVHQRVLGEGGQGSVDLQVKHTGRAGTLQHRAVKKIRLFGGGMQQSKLIQRELEAMFKFSQARYAELFVQSYGWFISDGLIYIAMEYYELGDLQKYLADSTRCPSHRLQEKDVHDISLQVLEALSLMHEQGFSHRDLKPANILIKHQPPTPWWIKLGDFGISKRGGELTQLTSIRGTQSFMPPELRFGNGSPETYAFAVDMWSFGETMYRMFTGEAMFDTPGLLRYWQGDASFPDATLRNLGISDSATEFIKKLVAPDPARRITSQQALHEPWIDTSAPSTHHPNIPAQPVSLPMHPGPPSDEYSNTWSQNTSFVIPPPLNPPTEIPEYSSDWPEPSFTGNTSTPGWTRERTYPPHSASRGYGVGTPASSNTGQMGFNSYSHQSAPYAPPPGQGFQQRSQVSRVSSDPYALSQGRSVGGLPGPTPDSHILGECKALEIQAETAYNEDDVKVAEELYDKIWHLKEIALGNDHLDTLTARAKLADVMLEQYNEDKLSPAEAMVRQVLTLRQTKLGNEHPDTMLSKLSLAEALSQKDEYDQAELIVKDVLSVQQRMLGYEHKDTLRSMVLLGEMFAYHREKRNDERMEQAERLYQQVLDIRTRILGKEHDDTVDVMINLAALFLEQEKYSESERIYQNALGIVYRNHGKKHRLAFIIMGQLAQVYHGDGRVSEAEKLLRELVEAKVRQLGEIKAASYFEELADFLGENDKASEAEELYRKVLRIRTEQNEEGRKTIDTMESLANLIEDKEEAEYLSREVIRLRKKVRGPEHLDTIRGLETLGNLLLWGDDEKCAEALPILEEAVRLRQKVQGYEHEETLSCRAGLAQAHSMTGNDEKAEEMYQAVIQIQKRSLGDQHASTLDTLSKLASLLMKTDRDEEAEAILRGVLKALEDSVGREDAETLNTMQLLSETLTNQEKYDAAKPVALDVFFLRKKVLGDEDEDTLESMYSLAVIHRHTDNYRLSEQLYEDLVKIRIKLSGFDDDDTMAAIKGLAEVFLLQGRAQKAESIYRKLFLQKENDPSCSQADFLDFKASASEGLYYTTFSSSFDGGQYRLAAKFQREVIEGRVANFGKGHPSTLTAMFSLARTLTQLNEYQEALVLLKEVVKMRKLVLGKDDDDTIEGMMDLAHVLVMTQNFSGEEAVLQELVEILRAKFGNTHEKTLQILDDLGHTSLSLGKDKAAEAIYRELLEPSKGTQRTPRYMNRTDLDQVTLHYMHRLADALMRQYSDFKTREAKDILEVVVRQRKALLGEDNPNTLASIELLQGCNERL